MMHKKILTIAMLFLLSQVQLFSAEGRDEANHSSEASVNYIPDQKEPLVSSWRQSLRDFSLGVAVLAIPVLLVVLHNKQELIGRFLGKVFGGLSRKRCNDSGVDEDISDE